MATVFTAADGCYGNEVAVILFPGDLPSAADRQAEASAAPEPATAFVAGDGTTVRIHNRKLERSFAGHPLLGTAAVLRTRGLAPARLQVPAGAVDVWSDGAREWLSAPAAWSPATRHRQLESPC